MPTPVEAHHPSTPPHLWRFFRAGGFDQVRIDTSADLLNLKHLDQKLWVALSCPTAGIEFDARTLKLIDTDADGHIRAPELLAAIDWAAARLSDTSVFEQKLAGVPLAAIREPAILAAARGLLPPGEALLRVETASVAEAEYSARALAAWEASGAAARPLGDATEAACAAVAAVKAKVDDFFVRCRLAAFDGRAGEAMNPSVETFKGMSAASLRSDHADIAGLPLARVEAGAAAPLDDRLNPAWAARMAALRTVAVTPLLGERVSLTEAEWVEVQARLAPYETWRAAKPAGLPPEAEAVRDLERLARCVRDLMALANNFVAFRDFYTRMGKATFQIGTLYLDGRAAELVISVNDAGRHAALADLSRVCLVYCDCVRPDAKQSIAAAFTAGDSDQLMAGRNGVFYDRQGRDWDATITKVIDNPISLRQAFYSPYKKITRAVADLLQKLAARNSDEVGGKLAEAAGGTLDPKADPAKAVGMQALDLGKIAGVFAAIGLAVGALGTGAASVVTGILHLKWWQMPLPVLGLLALISGPSVIVAWYKLRGRTLGPILDANGWAVNARAHINIPFGTSLTQLAALPPGAERSLVDPYATRRPRWRWLLLLLLLGAGGFLAWQNR
jgi:hypothetical protein